VTALLILDIGTTGLRASIVDGDARIRHIEHRPFAPTSPFPGLVEFDAEQLATLTVEAATSAIDVAGEPITAVGITNQRATTIVWDRASGTPVGPALGWQDLRTVTECIVARAEHDLALAPNQSATKVAWLLANAAGGAADDVCFGTVDSWLTWVLTGGAVHATDPSNASVTGLIRSDSSGWDERVCGLLGVPVGILPAIVDTTGTVIGEAVILDGAPPITSLAGDQQSSLVGQGCVAPGLAKITFGTGGMLDVCTGDATPQHGRRGEHGTYPIVAWSHEGERTWAREAIMLAAGSNIDWLRDDLGLIESSAHSAQRAAECDTSDGVVYVPALLGLGTPIWDYGARGALFGLTRGSTAAHVVRAVLEGVANRGVDLVESAEQETGLSIPTLRVDGGMSQNDVFVAALADAARRPVEVSPVVEATTVGSAYLAGLGAGVWAGMSDIAASWKPRTIVEPGAPTDRDVWRRALDRSRDWIPELSALDF
jgi:glycerol kinase